MTMGANSMTFIKIGLDNKDAISGLEIVNEIIVWLLSKYPLNFQKYPLNRIVFYILLGNKDHRLGTIDRLHIKLPGT